MHARGVEPELGRSELKLHSPRLSKRFHNTGTKGFSEFRTKGLPCPLKASRALGEGAPGSLGGRVSSWHPLISMA